MMSAGTRRWLYGVAGAAVPLLIAYNVITDLTAPLWLAAAAALLVPAVAIPHTTDTPPRRGRDDDGDGQPDYSD